MPLPLPQFQLSVELSNVFPIGYAVRAASDAVYSRILTFARDLRKSGSDLLVEEDLAAIFGRGIIKGEIENRFKSEVLKENNVVPVPGTGGIVLDSRPGPTVERALNNPDRYYLATVIQLSLLSWMHSRPTLASALTECMTQRFRLGVHGATPSPGYDGIHGMLEACSSQSAAFNWSFYVHIIEQRIAQSYTMYCPGPDDTTLTPNTLLAAMDYLYIIQRFPQERKMTVNRPEGFITLIIWAHICLDLSVLVSGIPGGDILFSTETNCVPHVLITWSDTIENKYDVEVCLLDSNMRVVLKPIEIGLSHMEACERLPLKDYGTVQLWRQLNKRTTVLRNSPVYLDAVHFVVAMAAVSLEKLLRAESTAPYSVKLNIQRWQIFEASRVLFASVPFDELVIDAYTKKLSASGRLKDMEPPTALQKHIDETEYMITPRQHWLQGGMAHLAAFVVVLASVAEVASCSELPLVADLEQEDLVDFSDKLYTCQDSFTVKSNDLFSCLAQMLIGGRQVLEEEKGGDHSLFMVSDFGWTLFLSSVGDRDPANVVPERLFLRKGIPTNEATGERKSRVRDAILNGYMLRTPTRTITNRGDKEGIAQCLYSVSERTAYYGSRRDEFRLNIEYVVQQSLEKTIHDFSVSWSYRAFHDALWTTTLPPPCTHPKNDSLTVPIKLNLDVAAGTAFHWFDEGKPGDREEPERICIALVKGNRHMRWLALADACKSTRRRLMLRGINTCVDCAVKAAAERAGKWLVII